MNCNENESSTSPRYVKGDHDFKYILELTDSAEIANIDWGMLHFIDTRKYKKTFDLFNFLFS